MKKTPTLFLAAIFSLSLQLCVFSQEEAQLTIKDYLEKALPLEEGRKIVYNESAKLLTVTDTKSNHKLIKQLIQQFEIGQRQVMIETRFVEVDVTDLFELGIEWDFYQSGRGVTEDPDSNSISRKFFKKPTINSISAASNIRNPQYQGIHWNDGASSVFPKTGNLAGQLLISKLTTAGDFLTANLRALEQQGKANLLSAPKVTTVSGQTANIQSSRTYPYVSDFTLENIGTAESPIWNYKLTISEKPVGISLEVTPYVSEGSNTITLDIHPEVSVLKSQIVISNLRAIGTTGSDISAASLSLGGGFAAQNTTALTAGAPLIDEELGWPVIDVRTTQTSMAIDSGETIVLGGMIKDNEIITKRKVPLLGDIPLLGKAFQYDYKSQEKKELLIFITASIITADGEVVR
ncbi:MAG: hypothetical protein V1933_04415 [Candidatus Omnitrophota bacterium]